MSRKKDPWLPSIAPLERVANLQGTGRLAFVRPAAALDNARLGDREEAECISGLGGRDFDDAMAVGLQPKPVVYVLGGRVIERWPLGELRRANRRLPRQGPPTKTDEAQPRVRSSEFVSHLSGLAQAIDRLELAAADPKTFSWVMRSHLVEIRAAIAGAIAIETASLGGGKGSAQ
ncbi:MAG: hypothetical protein R3E83_18475 [Burkholderiaceae bacterium]